MIKKLFVRFSLLILLAVVSESCVQNNGDIGSLFGVWRLTQLSADGTPLPIYDGDDTPEAYDWTFQGDVVKIEVIEPRHEHYSRYGIWSRDEDKLILDFSYGTDQTQDFDAPAGLHLISKGVTTLIMTVMTDKNMIGWYIDEEGVKYEYHLRKLY